VTEQEEELRLASNRTYTRLLASLPQEIATRYGYLPESQTDDLEARLEAAAKAKNWKLVADLAQQLADQAP
jgi:coproporphyrinogen III oxidase